MQSAIYATLLLPLIAALPVSNDSPFTIIANSASTINSQSIQANGGQFWFGKNTTTYCPLEQNCAIYSTNTTVLACDSTDGTATTCHLQDAGPGQNIYVRSDTGALSFTSLTAGGALPAGALGTGFVYQAGSGVSQGSFSFMGNGSTGLVACPADPNCDGSTGQDCSASFIVAALPGLDISNCLTFDALTTPSDVQAWEYI